jgi:hypothetical protein
VECLGHLLGGGAVQLAIGHRHPHLERLTHVALDLNPTSETALPCATRCLRSPIAFAWAAPTPP